MDGSSYQAELMSSSSDTGSTPDTEAHTGAHTWKNMEDILRLPPDPVRPISQSAARVGGAKILVRRFGKWEWGRTKREASRVGKVRCAKDFHGWQVLKTRRGPVDCGRKIFWTVAWRK